MLKKLFSSKKETLPKDIIVISGLPRSGTSMMMKMLAEGGLEIVTDALRTADDDNPNGYFEFEPVKQLTQGNGQWLEDARGKAVKIISALLEHLPTRFHYKVIFMERSLQEVLASQKKMLINRSEESSISDEEMEEKLKKHVADVKYWIARQPNIDVLYVDYGKMISSPAGDCTRIAEFIGVPVSVEKMLSVPNERLYRNRANPKS
jgi:hypothetical protein